MQLHEMEITQDTVLKWHNAPLSQLSDDQYIKLPQGTKLHVHAEDDQQKSHYAVRGFVFSGHVRIDMDTDQLSPNFKLHEFVVSEFAARNGLDNTPPLWAVQNLRALAINNLEPIRSWARTLKPNTVVRVTSGYRSQQVNAGVGGARNSHHRFGRAGDIVIPGVSPSQIYQFALRNLEFAELIAYKGFVHIAYHEGHNVKRHFKKL